MLEITVSWGESFDESTQEFVPSAEHTIQLEHTLVTLSKWEAVHEKPFLGKDPKTEEELLDYVKTMTVTPEVPEEVFLNLSEGNISEINAYLNAKQTATWFTENKNEPPSTETITAELVYYWMIQFQIPLEFEHWHLNRLFTMIRVCNVKQAKPKPMSKAELAAQRRKMNDERRQKFGTTG